MPDEKNSKPAASQTLSVQYGIERKSKDPIIVLELGGKTFAAMTVAQAHNFANDIVVSCARAEADAMIHGFFSKQQYPEGAADALMVEFRDFRARLDAEMVERSMSHPTLDGSDKPE
jgi:hypothetical protein